MNSWLASSIDTPLVTIAAGRVPHNLPPRAFLLQVFELLQKLIPQNTTECGRENYNMGNSAYKDKVFLVGEYYTY